MKDNRSLSKIYKLLLDHYGPQGWWPLTSKAHATGYDSGGYHKGDYTVPAAAREKFEVILGAVLTQNTAWTNVRRALDSLEKKHCTLPEHVLKLPLHKLAKFIRSSGYYNQKAKKLKQIAEYFSTQSWLRDGKIPLRQDLLALWGVGEETADSILLYAFGCCSFVVDAYTKRLLSRVGIIDHNTTYRLIQDLFHEQLECTYQIYNEYHALIVQHAKVHCRKKPLCEGCPLAKICLT
jgi:endonuclease-3 related protein